MCHVIMSYQCHDNVSRCSEIRGMLGQDERGELWRVRWRLHIRWESGIVGGAGEKLLTLVLVRVAGGRGDTQYL
jgi:hypothetical protein